MKDFSENFQTIDDLKTCKEVINKIMDIPYRRFGSRASLYIYPFLLEEYEDFLVYELKFVPVAGSYMNEKQFIKYKKMNSYLIGKLELKSDGKMTLVGYKIHSHSNFRYAFVNINLKYFFYIWLFFFLLCAFVYWQVFSKVLTFACFSALIFFGIYSWQETYMEFHYNALSKPFFGIKSNLRNIARIKTSESSRKKKVDRLATTYSPTPLPVQYHRR